MRYYHINLKDNPLARNVEFHFRYPFVVEYSLICAGICFVFRSKISRENVQQPANDDELVRLVEDDENSIEDDDNDRLRERCNAYARSICRRCHKNWLEIVVIAGVAILFFAGIVDHLLWKWFDALLATDVSDLFYNE